MAGDAEDSLEFRCLTVGGGIYQGSGRHQGKQSPLEYGASKESHDR